MLGADNLRYLKTVLRLKPGDQIIVFDGFGHEFEAHIESFSASGVNVCLGAPIPQADKKIRMTLAQAIPKAGKMDLIVKTAAELGDGRHYPFYSRPFGQPDRRRKSVGKSRPLAKDCPGSGSLLAQSSGGRNRAGFIFCRDAVKSNARRPKADFLGRRRSAKHSGCAQ